MITTVTTAATIGFGGQLVTIECDSSNGLPNLHIVGLGNKAIDESRERIRSAIKHSNLEFPRKRITLNLAPANIPKTGSGYDLPLALAILGISGQLSPSSLRHTLVAGELALDGSIRPIEGVINVLETARQHNFTHAIIPESNQAQASLIEGITVFTAASLKEVVSHLHQLQRLPEIRNHRDQHPSSTSCEISIEDIAGHEQAKRALIIAAAGGHNILMHGPPGSGKTMLAKALQSLLPDPSAEEIIAITKLQSLSSNQSNEIAYTRPFRSPHHTASHVALIGGGNPVRPGEISLAHHGVLFLDELPEYSRNALESLRQPLEEYNISIARAQHRYTFPAKFILIATQNPCPCGYLGDADIECVCSQNQIAHYTKKISGPLLDRIDLQLKVPRLNQERILEVKSNSYTSEQARELIIRARSIQQRRFGSNETNSALTAKQITSLGLIEKSTRNFLDVAAKKMTLSARSYLRVIKVARTIADLEEQPLISVKHISEALQYRQRQ